MIFPVKIPVGLLETYLLPSTTYGENITRHPDAGFVINFTSKKTILPDRVKENVSDRSKNDNNNRGLDYRFRDYRGMETEAICEWAVEFKTAPETLTNLPAQPESDT